MKATAPSGIGRLRVFAVPGNRLLAILAGRRTITADTAIRLGAATGTSAELWLGLQAAHDLEVARSNGVGVDARRIAA